MNWEGFTGKVKTQHEQGLEGGDPALMADSVGPRTQEGAAADVWEQQENQS